MTVVALRPAKPADSEFCFRLHKAAMGDYVAAIWGWDDRRQREFHDRAFTPGRWRIITANGTDAGLLDVEYRPGEIYLSRIEIDPRYQGRAQFGRQMLQPVDLNIRARDAEADPKRGRFLQEKLQPENFACRPLR